MEPTTLYIQTLQQMAATIQPTGFLDYKAYLHSLYFAMKQQDKNYSYNRFASDLGFTASNLFHQIIKGHRPLSVKNAKKISAALELAKVEHQYFIALVEYINEDDSRAKEELFQDLMKRKGQSLPTALDKSWLEFFGEWFHPVILEAVGLYTDANSAEDLAERIVPRLRPEQIKRSLELLQKLDLIRYDEKTKVYSRNQQRLSTGPRVQDMGVTSYHQKMMDMAKDALTRFSADQRDISAMTVSVDQKTYEQLRQLVHQLQMQILDTAELAEKPDQIYQINIQMFPFTK